MLIEVTNSIGMKLVLIPPGEFMMGSAPDDIDRVRQGFNTIRLGFRVAADLAAVADPVRK